MSKLTLSWETLGWTRVTACSVQNSIFYKCTKLHFFRYVHTHTFTHFFWLHTETQYSSLTNLLSVITINNRKYTYYSQDSIFLFWILTNFYIWSIFLLLLVCSYFSLVTSVMTTKVFHHSGHIYVYITIQRKQNYWKAKKCQVNYILNTGMGNVFFCTQKIKLANIAESVNSLFSYWYHWHLLCSIPLF